MRALGLIAIGTALALAGCDAQSGRLDVAQAAPADDSNVPISAHGIVEPVGQAYAAPDFRRLIAGKRPAEVVALLGQPQSVMDNSGAKTFSYDRAQAFTVRDETTGKTFRTVMVTFNEAGYAIGVFLA